MRRRGKKVKRKPFRLALMAEEALKLAVYEAIKDHERTNDPVAIWRNGKAILIHPRRLKLKKPILKYLKKAHGEVC